MNEVDKHFQKIEDYQAWHSREVDRHHYEAGNYHLMRRPPAMYLLKQAIKLVLALAIIIAGTSVAFADPYQDIGSVIHGQADSGEIIVQLTNHSLHADDRTVPMDMVTLAYVNGAQPGHEFLLYIWKDGEIQESEYISHGEHGLTACHITNMRAGYDLGYVFVEVDGEYIAPPWCKVCHPTGAAP